MALTSSLGFLVQRRNIPSGSSKTGCGKKKWGKKKKKRGKKKKTGSGKKGMKQTPTGTLVVTLVVFSTW